MCRHFRTSALFLSAALGVFLMSADMQAAAPVALSSDSNKATAAQDAQTGPLVPEQVELLELAYGVASALPLDPHIKNRSRLQGEVATTCLELGAPERALGYFDGIANWRRGFGYASYAYSLASTEHVGDLERFLDLAQTIASAEDGWRRQRIQSTIARTYALLGDKEAADSLATGLIPVEAERLVLELPTGSEADECEAHMKWAEQTFLSGDFDLVRAAFNGCVRLYGEHYQDVEAREALAAFVQSSLHKAPMDIGIGVLLRLARAAVEHGGAAQGLEFVKQVESLVDGEEWLPEHEVPMLAQIAEARFVCGDLQGAAARLESAHHIYSERRAQIVDVFRADALLPLAQAFQTTGSADQARKLYALSIEEALLNPNSRPRAEDLVAACCSMARSGVVPGEPLLTQLRSAAEGLGAPW